MNYNTITFIFCQCKSQADALETRIVRARFRPLDKIKYTIEGSVERRSEVVQSKVIRWYVQWGSHSGDLTVGISHSGDLMYSWDLMYTGDLNSGNI